MRTLQYVEIDIDFCSLVYSVAPCAAALGVTGEKKCFNSRKTCQDVANFSPQVKTLRYAVAASYLPGDINAIPSIKSISYSPQKIEPGQSIGVRASVNISFVDHPHTDTDLDRYYDERDYIPVEQGSYWSKFRARHPFIIGRSLRLIEGIEGQSINEMTTRHFVIESYNGPGVDGVFSITAKDILKITDGDRAQAPIKSNGVLATPIDESETELELAPAGIGDAEYPLSGSIAIGEEAMTFTRSGDTLTVTRAQYNTDPSQHDENDTVQVMLVITSESASTIIRDLFLNYTACLPEYIPYDEWVVEVDNYINRLYSARIGTPTDVDDLINEVIEQVGLVMWWDEEAALIRLRSLRPVLAGTNIINDDVILRDTLRMSEQPAKRVSQVWTWFGQLSPLEDLTRQANYAAGLVTPDAQAEIDYGQPAIKKIYSRWISGFNRTAAQRLNAQILSRYRDPPRAASFAVDRYKTALVLGKGFNLMTRPLQDDEGKPAMLPMIVTSLVPKFDRYEVTAEEMVFVPQEDLTSERVIFVDQDTYNFNLRSAHDSIYPPPGEGQVILCVVTAEVYIGSTTAGSAFAFLVGDWPADCDITIKIMAGARIQGAGGVGGAGGAGIPELDGRPGGWAFYTRYAVTIENFGMIAGGGGGGGAGWERGDNYVGGAGGAGFKPGNEGATLLAPATNTGPDALVFIPGSAATPDSGGTHSFANYPDNWTILPGDGGGIAQPGTTGRVFYPDVGFTHFTGAGAAGGAVDGESFITYTTEGSIFGSRVN